MRHRGEHVGHFIVGDKADGEAFTQAPVAIANARTHRAVERARADLAPGG